MPQYMRKIRQMISVTGIHPPVNAGKWSTVAGNVVTSVGKAQYISKGAGNSWPGADWIASLGPGHASYLSEIVDASEEVPKPEPQIEKKAPTAHHSPGHHSTQHKEGSF